MRHGLCNIDLPSHGISTVRILYLFMITISVHTKSINVHTTFAIHVWSFRRQCLNLCGRLHPSAGPSSNITPSTLAFSFATSIPYYERVAM